MGIVVIQSPTWVQGSSYLGYDNGYLRSDAVISASAADTGFPFTNAASWLITGGGWRATVTPEVNLSLTLSAAQQFNSYAIHKHNLGTLGATVKLQYSSDGVVWNDVAGSTKVLANDKTVFFIGDNNTATNWRINITNLPSPAQQAIIGQVFIGPALNLYNPPEPGFTPPELALNNDYISSRADGGDYLGRSLIRKGSKMQFSNSIVSRDWIRANWQDVMAAIEKTPFYYAWDSTNYPAEVAYCYVERKIDHPKYVNSGYFSLSLKFMALTE